MIQQAQAIWETTQEKIRLRIDQHSFTTWIKPVKALGINDNTLLLSVPTLFHVERLEKHYLETINEALSGVSEQKLSVQLVPLAEKSLPRPSDLAIPMALPFTDESGITDRYTFESFVIGKSNEFAYAASYATAQSPGKQYNPLFIYGGVGLGKTHLMQAIGHYHKSRKPKARICYTPAEKFMNEMVGAIQNRKTPEFRNRYRSLDMLLIDDVQFLSNKPSIQEEIFHTFNSLYDVKKQIVLTSDRTPKDIDQLEDRLVSRFLSGLVADIQPPDMETRVAILRKKAANEGFAVPGDVFAFIAETVTSNIRELEGCLNRVVGLSSVSEQELTVDLAKEAIKNIVTTNGRKAVTIEAIQKAVANFFSISEESLKSKKRTKELVIPRQIAMYLCRKITKASLNDIGGRFGGKDHSTVLYSFSRISDEMEAKSEIAVKVERITSLIKGE